jgi:universal stress protein A
MSFKKILAAIDFSNESREALRVAAATAAASHAELTLLHVWEAAAYTYSPSFALPGNVVDDAIAEAERGVTDWKHRAIEIGATKVATQVVPGVAWDRIVETAKADPAYDLIVVGTHGRTGLSHVVMGSVAEKVVRHAPCAVLVVRARPAK